uniref:Uncharacterized protein n=1 Tax=Anguilla anguilla TaxID=7936 RepID=A0A0E9WLE1_ANGAN
MSAAGLLLRSSLSTQGKFLWNSIKHCLSPSGLLTVAFGSC